MEFLNGKKTYLGVIAWGVIQILLQVQPEWASALGIAETLALTLTGIGAGHKLTKVA